MVDLSTLSNEQLQALYDQRNAAPSSTPPQGAADVSKMSDDDLRAAYTDQGRKRVYINTPRASGEPPKDDTPPTTGVGEAIGRGVTQGLTFNFGDELQGILAAGGKQPDQPADLSHLITGLYNYWKDDPDAAKAYDDRVKQERDRTALVEKEHPIAYNLAQVGSTLAIPGIGEAEGLGLGARALRSAGTGAAFGAASGLGEGEDTTDRLGRAASGGTVGGVVGGVASPLINLALTGAKSAGTKIFGGLNPDNTAAKYVAAGVDRDIRADPGAANRLTPPELAATPDARVVDLGGSATRALARTATNISPEADAALKRVVNDRFAGQSDRVNNWFNQNFHYPNAEATQAALDDVERTVNNKNYAKAFSAGDKPIMTPDMQHMVDNAPAVTDAIKAAIPEVKNRAVAMGMGARNPGIRFEAGMPVFDRGPPNLQFWDNVKRQLDARAAKGFREGDPNASSYSTLAKKLRNELDTQVSEYAPARQGAARFFGAENAMDAGSKFFNNQMTAEQGRQALARFSPTERRLFQDGFVTEYMDKIAGRGDRTNVLNQIANSPKAREKLNVALGPQKTSELEAHLRGENIMDRARGAITGNSTTVAQLAAAGIIGAGTGYEVGDLRGATMGTVMSAALAAGAKHGNAKVNQQVMQRVGEMLASRDPSVVDRGRRLIARSEKMMNVLRHADTLVAKVTGAEGGTNLPAPGR